MDIACFRVFLADGHLVFVFRLFCGRLNAIRVRYVFDFRNVVISVLPTHTLERRRVIMTIVAERNPQSNDEVVIFVRRLAGAAN